MRNRLLNFIWLLIFAGTLQAAAQENVAPLQRNPVLRGREKAKMSGSVYKTTALSLPFFEDFTSGYFPDSSRWEDNRVYINNTMGVNPISHGVATFDGLNAAGIPYNTQNSLIQLVADSFTSRTFDLSTHNPGDSIYLSFFYQPQGNGFSPESSDSFLLHMRKRNGWVKVWGKDGTAVQPFKQVMIPIADTAYFHDKFQFMFSNKVSMNINDDHWHLDYIRVAANRSFTDTLINDVAFSVAPTNLLNDYTSMPYHQFLANQNAERTAQMSASIRNNYIFGQSVNYGYVATGLPTATPLGSGNGNVSITQGQEQQASFPVYTTVAPSPANKGLYVNFETKYFINPIPGDNSLVNDTIVHNQVFHNYLAYDDGTAEKSYYLNQFITLPGKLAIDHRLNEADELTGIAIYFGRQVPMGYNKYFSVVVYEDIAVNGGTEKVLYQEDFLYPGYLGVDQFYTYKFSQPVQLQQGTFYIGTIQPASANSDSLYFGLDVNRPSANHLYYNVLGTWESSQIAGAIMIRPILGPIIPSGVNDVKQALTEWHIQPNPATEFISPSFGSDHAAIYSLYDMQGRTVQIGNCLNNEQIDIAGLRPGIYFMTLTIDGKISSPKKIVKL